MQVHRKIEKHEQKGRTSIYAGLSIIAQIDAESNKLGCANSTIWEKAALMYLKSSESVSTTPYEKKYYAMELLKLNCSNLKSAMGEPLEGDIIQYFRFFFATCMQNADGTRVKNGQSVDKDREMSVFLLLQDLKSTNIKLYDQITKEMGQYGNMKDRYIKLLDV